MRQKQPMRLFAIEYQKRPAATSWQESRMAAYPKSGTDAAGSDRLNFSKS